MTTTTTTTRQKGYSSGCWQSSMNVVGMEQGNISSWQISTNGNATGGNEQHEARFGQFEQLRERDCKQILVAPFGRSAISDGTFPGWSFGKCAFYTEMVWKQGLE